MTDARNVGTERAGEQDPAGTDAAVELLIRFAREGHDAGYPTADLEERVLALAGASGLADVEVSATPTLVEVSIGSLPLQRTYTMRVRPTSVDLDAIARLDGLVEDELDGPLDAGDALRTLRRIEETPLHRPWPLVLAAYATAGAALTPVLGGRWPEAAGAALVGLVVGAIALSTRRTARTEPMVAPIAAVAASFCAALLVRLGLHASADVITLAALVTLLPGMTLTIGMRELATEHLQSGVANTASALVQLFGLAFGVAVGKSIASNWFGVVTGPPPPPAWLGVQLGARAPCGARVHGDAAGSLAGCARDGCRNVPRRRRERGGRTALRRRRCSLRGVRRHRCHRGVSSGRSSAGRRSSSSSRPFSCSCLAARASTAWFSCSPTRRSAGSPRPSTPS